MNREIQIVIVGGGIGGLSLAGFLRQAGLDPVVVDRAPELDQSGGAVELWPEAMALLAHLGVATAVREAGTTVTEWSRRRPDGTVAARRIADVDGFVSIRYGRLREQLLEVLPDGSVRTGTALQSFETSGGAVSVTLENGVREQFDLAVGADGARSRTRELLEVEPTVSCGTRSVAVPLPSDADLPGAIEVWTADGPVVRALPAGDRSMGWLTVPTDGHGNRTDPGALADALERGGTDLGIVAGPGGVDVAIPDALRSADPAEVWCDEDVRAPADVWAAGRVALVGDAAHARHRLAGVGPTLAIEDAATLASALVDREGPLPSRLSAFADRRRGRMRRLTDRPGGESPGEPQAVDGPFSEDQSSILEVRASQLAAAFGSDVPQPAVTPPSTGE